MVSRIFKEEIKDWWDNGVDQFIAEQATKRGQLASKVNEETLYAEGASEQYEIFWFKFPEDLYNWLRRLKVQNRAGGILSARRSWTSSDIILLQ